MPESTFYETANSAFAAYLVYRGCRVVQGVTTNGNKAVTYQLDLCGQAVEVLEAEYWCSEAYRVEDIKVHLIRRYVRR